MVITDIEAVATDSSKEHLSKRHKVFLELVETESNYVGILNTIMTVNICCTLRSMSAILEIGIFFITNSTRVIIVQTFQFEKSIRDIRPISNIVDTELYILEKQT